MTGLREEKKQETRRRIIEAAWTLFTGKGFATTTISAIARKARVGTGTVYNYFASKEHVLAAHFTDQFAPVLEKINATPKTDDPYADVMAIIQAMGPYMFQEPVLMREAMSVFFAGGKLDDLSPDGLAEELMRGDMEVLGFLTAVLENGKTAGKLDPNLDCQLAAMTIYSTFIMTWIGYIFNMIPSAEIAQGIQGGMIAQIFNGLKGDRT